VIHLEISMCGIDGILSKEIVDEKIIKGMTTCMIHRGPHSEGFFHEKNIGLGMRRLKIIDLESGDQPIFNEKNDILVIFNGEIYNFENLKKDLERRGHIFKSKTDTEVLVHGYEEWGISELLSRLNGMYAFCIYDKKERKAYIVRDRLGEKPLYYFYDGNDFIFGSELKVLLESGKIPIEISKLGLYCYLSLQYIPGDISIIKNVKKLLPAHYLEINIENLEMKLVEYWNLKEKNYEERSYSDNVKRTRELVEDSIKIRMVADVPVGLFLSGGIDSSIIAYVMKKLNPDLNTFSVGFSNMKFDESEFSKSIAKEFHTNHFHFVLEHEKVRELLPKIVKSMDEPSGDQALLPVFWLSHEAKKHVSVVLGGEGGDEVFGGYSYYQDISKFQEIPNNTTGLFVGFFNGSNETTSGFPLLSDHHMRSKLLKNFQLDELLTESLNYVWFEKFLASIKQIENGLRQRQFVDIKTWLPEDLLMKFDKMSMSQSLEGRAPFLDYRLVDFAFNLPSIYKIEQDISKKILRDAFKDVLPKKIFERQKQGFNLPMAEWLKTHLLDLLKKIPEIEFDDGLDNNYIKNLIDMHVSGKHEFGRLLYSILIYKLWIKNLFEKIGNNF